MLFVWPVVKAVVMAKGMLPAIILVEDGILSSPDSVLVLSVAGGAGSIYHVLLLASGIVICLLAEKDKLRKL